MPSSAEHLHVVKPQHRQLVYAFSAYAWCTQLQLNWAEPAIRRRSVVFPHPLGPTTASLCPLLMIALTSENSWVCPSWVLPTFSRVSNVSLPFVDLGALTSLTALAWLHVWTLNRPLRLLIRATVLPVFIILGGVHRQNCPVLRLSANHMQCMVW